MKITNRVFFTTEQEAIAEGYRPCGHCMKEKYKEWKARCPLHALPKGDGALSPSSEEFDKREKFYRANK